MKTQCLLTPRLLGVLVLCSTSAHTASGWAQAGSEGDSVKLDVVVVARPRELGLGASAKF
jgi:hypothetical protein